MSKVVLGLPCDLISPPAMFLLIIKSWVSRDVGPMSVPSESRISPAYSSPIFRQLGSLSPAPSHPLTSHIEASSTLQVYSGGVTISTQAEHKWVKVQVGRQLEGTGQAEAVGGPAVLGRVGQGAENKQQLEKKAGEGKHGKP